MKRRRKPKTKAPKAGTAAEPAPAPDPRSLEALVARYLEWLATRNYSEQTVHTRRIDLGKFVAWCEERSLSRPSEVTKPVLEHYQRHLHHHRTPSGRPLSFSTQHSRLCGLRAFFKWLARRNLILFNPAADLELPRSEQRLPRHTLTTEEVEQVLAQPDITDPLGLRDRAILETLYSTGMRRSELLTLRVYDIHAHRGTVLVHGKGKKDRIIPIGERALIWIDKYFQEARPLLAIEPDDGTLFLSEEGTALSRDRLSDLAGGYLEKAAIQKPGACHIFRHTMATLMLEAGADIRFIQQMLGHASLESTQIYTKVSIHPLKEVHNRTHPGAKLHDRGPGPGVRGPKEQDPKITDGGQRETDNSSKEELLSSLAAEAAEEDED